MELTASANTDHLPSKSNPYFPPSTSPFTKITVKILSTLATIKFHGKRKFIKPPVQLFGTTDQHLDTSKSAGSNRLTTKQKSEETGFLAINQASVTRSAQKGFIMKLKVFTVRDSKSETFNVPFFAKTVGEATRNLTETMRDERTLINKYPEDYSLWMLGDYDDQTGTLDAHPPTHVINAIQLRDERPMPQASAETLRLSQ